MSCTSSRFCSRVIWLAWWPVDAPPFHHHRLHAGRQQLDQRALGRVVGQQGKVPGDAVVELLFAEGGLEVNLRVILVLFHVAQVAGRAQGQRAADAEVGEQHLALLVKDGLSVLEQGQGDVFQRQTHHLFAVGVVAHKAHETGTGSTRVCPACRASR